MSTRATERGIDQIREITVVYEGLERVDGSARFGFGSTYTLASVSGPIEVRTTQENPSQATLDIQIRPLAALPGTDAKALATTLKAIFSPSLFLSHNPRTLIQIVGQALCGPASGSGTGSVGRGWNVSLTASLVNATAAALVNAGSIPMRGVVCAAAVGQLKTDEGEGGLILDPEETELSQLAGTGCFAFLFSSLLSASDSDSADIPAPALLWTNYTTAALLDVKELVRARELAEKGARQVWLAMKQSIESAAATSIKGETKLEHMPQTQPSAMHMDDEKVKINPIS